MGDNGFRNNSVQYRVVFDLWVRTAFYTRYYKDWGVYFYTSQLLHRHDNLVLGRGTLAYPAIDINQIILGLL